MARGLYPMASAGGPDDNDGRAASARRAIMDRVQSPDESCRVDAAREIRRLTKTSSKNRRHLAPAIEPLVAMLKAPGGSAAAHEAALLALLNLAVKDERNKIKILDAGALSPITGFLESPNTTLQECATAAVLTLSACAANKLAISDAGIIPTLVTILREGTHQAKLDAVMAIYNLSTLPGNLTTILQLRPVPPIVSLLKRCAKASKPAEKCSALLEALLRFDEARVALTAEEGGVLAVVEVLEEGSLQSREHAVGALLTMCESDRRRYREAILKEGAIPGLLELTVQGTPKAQLDARKLLQLLRESPYRRSAQLQPEEALESIVCGIVSRINGTTDDRGEKARKMLEEMVQVSMEQSLRHLQQRAALACTPAAAEIPALSAAKCPSARLPLDS